MTEHDHDKDAVPLRLCHHADTVTIQVTARSRFLPNPHVVLPAYGLGIKIGAMTTTATLIQLPASIRRVAAADQAVRAVIYLRLSDLREEDLDEFGLEKTLDMREQELRELAEDLGWSVVGVLKENDVGGPEQRGVSAFKTKWITLPDGRQERRTYRPAFRELLAMLWDGRANGILTEALDRLVRDHRDGEDLLDAVVRMKVSARSLSETLTLTRGGTDKEVSDFRAEVAAAHKESVTKRFRAKKGRKRKQRKGEHPGGTRPFGFDNDGTTHRPVEVEALRYAARAVLQVDALTGKRTALRQVARDLDAQGVRAAKGGPMTARALREYLLRARNVGLCEWQGEYTKAAWEPILDRDTWEAVVGVLTESSRTTTPGTAAKYLGSGVFLCGVCATLPADQRGVVRCHAQSHISKRTGEKVSYNRYVCHRNGSDTGHLALRVDLTDALVLETVVEVLAHPDITAALQPTVPDVDVDGLRAEAARIRASMADLAKDMMAGHITRDQMLAGTATGSEMLAEVEKVLRTANVRPSAAATLADQPDVRAAWEGLTLVQRKGILAELMTITLLPVGRGKRWRPGAVVIEPIVDLPAKAA